MGQLQIKMQRQIEISEKKKKYNNFMLTSLFCMSESLPCSLWWHGVTQKLGDKNSKVWIC
jgi:hypothetical protein